MSHLLPLSGVHANPQISGYADDHHHPTISTNAAAAAAQDPPSPLTKRPRTEEQQQQQDPRRVTGEGLGSIEKQQQRSTSGISNSWDGNVDVDDDDDDDDNSNGGGSEGGDDIHCTQIVVDLYDSLTEDDDDDDDDHPPTEDTSEKKPEEQHSWNVSNSNCPKIPSHDTTKSKDSQDWLTCLDDDDEEDLSEDELLIDLRKKDPTENAQDGGWQARTGDVLDHYTNDSSTIALAPTNQKDPDDDFLGRHVLDYDTVQPSIVLEGRQENNGIVLVDNNKDNMTCLVCGASLAHLSTGLKGRLIHIKRCSKNHGVQAKDVRVDDDHELFVGSANDATLSTANNNNDHSSLSSNRNPYHTMNRGSKDWHGNAVVDLTIAAASRDQDDGTNEQQPATTAASKPSLNSVLMAGARRAFAKPSLPSLTSVLMAGARRVAKIAKIKATGPPNKIDNNHRKRGWGGGRRIDYSQRACPFYKKIPGTDFVCDGFLYARSSLTKNYFLTHFHSDHYGGITKNWDSGVIYCSPATANLVHQQLGVDRKYLHPLPMQTPVVVESQGKPVTVTLLDANHCPGAVMFLFEVGKRRILHVGDFRWNRTKMLEQSAMRLLMTGGEQQRVDDLFLDTTYCDAKYVLPTQDVAIEATVEVAVRELAAAKSSRQKILMLFGAYTIGKERIYLSVAERLGMKVYVDNRRYRILSALDWPKEKLNILTTRPEETILWVAPLSHINMKKLPSYLSVRINSFGRDFDRVVGFRPTGWSMTAKGNDVVKSTGKGKLTVHSVPYSEHSSFPELVDCVTCLRPKRIIPTVSVSKSQQQVDLILSQVQREHF